MQNVGTCPRLALNAVLARSQGHAGAIAFKGFWPRCPCITSRAPCMTSRPVRSSTSMQDEEKQSLARRMQDFSAHAWPDTPCMTSWSVCSMHDVALHARSVRSTQDEDKWDFDPLDDTKIWPEDIFPLQPVGGKLALCVGGHTAA